MPERLEIDNVNQETLHMTKRKDKCYYFELYIDVLLNFTTLRKVTFKLMFFKNYYEI